MSPARLLQLLVKVFPMADVAVLRLRVPHGLKRQRNQRMQQVMELMLIAQIGPYLAAYCFNRSLIQSSRASGNAVGQRAAKIDGARAAFLQSGIVEERVWIRVQQFMRELRRNRRIDGEAANRSILNSAQYLDQAFQVHRFLQHILHHLVHQRVVGESGCRRR